MVGMKGRSGRKPDTSGWIARAVALYIPSFVSGHKKGKKQYTQIHWFRLFKKIYGSRATSLSPYNWQEQIRRMIRACVIDYTDRNGWFCECTHDGGTRLVRWHFRHDHSCTKCGYEPNKLERHRTQREVDIHTPAPRRSEVAKQPLKVCPVHNRPFERTDRVMVAGVQCKVPKCPSCKGVK